MNDGKEVFYLNGFKIVNSNGLFWIGDSYGVLCGPLGSIEEARDWAQKHYPVEFETRMFLKSNKFPLNKP